MDSKALYKRNLIVFLNIFLSIIMLFHALSVFMSFQGLIDSSYADASGGFVSFTFDVVNKDTYDRIKPVLSSKNIPATIYAQTGPINSGKTYAITYDQLKALQDTYHWEIGSHSISHPRLTQLSDEALDLELSQSKKDLESHGLKIESFATPYGNFNLKVLSRIAKYYKSHRSAQGGLNSYPFNDYNIIVRSVFNTTKPSDVKMWIDEAKQKNKWLILQFETVVANDVNTTTYEYKISDFENIVQIVSDSGIKANTISSNLTETAPNILSNPSFENLTNGWANDWVRKNTTYIGIDQNRNGAFPLPTNALKLKGGPEKYVVFSKQIIASPAKSYLIKFYENLQNYQAGKANVYIDEFNRLGKWFSGKWLGSSTSNNVRMRSFIYTPNPGTSKIDLAFYSSPLSNFTLFIDRISITELIPSSSEPPVTTISLSPTNPDGNNGWYVTQPIVNLSSSKAGTTYYRTGDSASFSVYQGGVSVPLGTNNFYYYSKDDSGVSEAVKSAIIKFDNVPPRSLVEVNHYDAYLNSQTVSFPWNVEEENTWNGKIKITVRLYKDNVLYRSILEDSMQPLSGSISYKLDIPSGSGYILRVFAEDNAGNDTVVNRTFFTVK